MSNIFSPVKRFFGKYYSTEGAPPEIFNRTLYIACFVFGILGCARGYDEGYIGGLVVKEPFIERFGLNNPDATAEQLADLASNITSMVLVGSIGGSLLAMVLVDRFGRIRTLQGVCIGWIIAVVIQITSQSVGQLHVGRLFEGFCVGQTVVIGPCYLSEISPKNIRGLTNCIFAGAVYVGSFLSNFINYGCAVNMDPDSDQQWIVPTAFKIVLAGLLFIGSLFCYESPRWLVKRGRVERSALMLSKIRHLPTDHTYIQSEIHDIQAQLALEEEARGKYTLLGIFKELFLVKSVRYRILLALTAQILGQWSFAGSITVYMPDLVGLVGVQGNDRLLYSCFLGVVKFTSAYISAFFIIDYFGRKRALYLGITVQLLSTLFFAIYMIIVPNGGEEGSTVSDSARRASYAALAALYMSGVGWTMGWNSIQYLINAEMLPLGVRNIGTAMIMAWHYIHQYSTTKAMPSMLITITPGGTFFMGSAMLLMGLFWAWFFLPEISGRSLESMEELFDLPWYLIGRKGAQLCPDRSDIAQLKDNDIVDAESKEDDIVERTESRDNSSTEHRETVDLEKADRNEKQ